MAKPVRILAAAILIGLAIFAWQTLFPGTARIIRSRLNNLAETASFQNEGNLAKAYNAQKLAEFFTRDATITADFRGHAPRTLDGRDEILQAALGARQAFRGMTVEFLDMQVAVGPDKLSATVDLTARVTIAGEPDFWVQELNVRLTKTDGKWLIAGIETVKTLSRLLLTVAADVSRLQLHPANG